MDLWIKYELGFRQLKPISLIKNSQDYFVCLIY